MLNKTFAAVYRRLRKMAGLTQRQAARRLKVGRSKIQRIEAGLARLDPEKEARLIELARCWDEHLVEMFCEEFSRLIKKLVSIGNGHGGFQSTTALAKAQTMMETHSDLLCNASIREMNNKMDINRFMELTLQKNNAELEETTQRCIQEARICGSKVPE